MKRMNDVVATAKFCLSNMHSTKHALDSLRVTTYEMQVAGKFSNTQISDEDIAQVVDQINDLEKSLVRIYSAFESDKRLKRKHSLFAFLGG